MSRDTPFHQGFFSAFCFLVCLAAFLASLAWVIVDAGRFAPAADFKVFYAAGRIVAEGQGQELYVTTTQDAMIQREIGGHFKYFFNPPAFVLPLVPLSHLPLMSAYWLWTGLSLLALFFGLRVLLSLTGLGRAERWLLAAAALAFEPTYHNLHWGNVSAFMLLLVALFFRDLLAGRERCAGFWLALLMVKPELFLISAAVLVGKRRWQAVTTYLLTGLALLLISFAVVGIEGFGHYIALNLEAASSYTSVQSVLNLRGMLGWRGLFVRLLGGVPLAEGLALAFAVLSLLALWITWRGEWQPGSDRLGQQWALTLLVSLLTSPHVYLQSLILALPAVVLVLRPLSRSESFSLALRSLPHLSVTVVAVSWVPHIEPLWGVTLVQLALIGSVVALVISLLAHPAEKNL